MKITPLLIALSATFAHQAIAQRNLKDIPPPDPEVEKASFKVPDGFEVNLWAADPLLAKPAQISFDRQGRLWVASSETYPQLNVNQEPSDRILILEDSDNNGQADKSSVFYDKLIIPGGVLPDGNGGCYVAHGEEFIQLVDIDGDGKADRKDTLLSGFGTEDTHHTLHRLRWGPGGMIYMLQGYYIGSHVETLYGPRRLNGGGLWYYDPRTRRLEIYSRGLINPWGVAFDRWGQSFETDGAGGWGINYAFPNTGFTGSPHERQRHLNGLNPRRPKSCGLEIVSGSHFPPEWSGSLITNDFRAQNIDRYVLEPKESGYVSKLQPDVLSSGHLSFRPIDVVMGPDGALFVADWYSPIIQHGEVDFRDKRRDQVHGRIWRITAKNRPLVEKLDYGKASIAQLLDWLKHDADWVRLNARQELKKHDESTVSAAIQEWVAKLDPKHPDYEHHRLEALWAYQTITTQRSRQLVYDLLKSPDHRVRAAAVRVLYHWHDSPEVLAPLVNDPHPQVRREAVTTLGQLGSPEALAIALGVLNHPIDQFIDYALWRTCRLLEPTWLPTFQRGKLKLGENAEHLGFALKAVEKPEALAPLVAKLRNDSKNTDPEVVRLVGKIGSAKDLDAVLRIAAEEAHPLAPHAALALAEAVEDRGLSPENSKQREAACRALLKLDDSRALDATYRLVGAWKIIPLGMTLAERLADADDEPKPGAAKGLALFGDARTLQKIVLNEEAGLMGRISAAAALIEIAPKDSAPDVARLLRQKLPREAVEILMGPILSNKVAAAALAAEIGKKRIDGEVAIHISRLAEVSGTVHATLPAALITSGSMRAISAADSDKFKRLMDKLPDGEVARGKKVYHRAELTCAVCHAIDGKGGAIGPDLSSIGASAPDDYLISSLLWPSLKIKEGYQMAVITTKEDEVVAGTVVRENQNVLVVRSPYGAETRVPKANVKSRKNSDTSMMPSGLTSSLTDAEFVDLVAYLSSLGKAKED